MKVNESGGPASTMPLRTLRQRPELQKFVNYTIKNGLTLVKQAGSVPISSSTYRLVESKLHQKVSGTAFGGDIPVGLTTSQALQAGAAAGALREDLFHRLVRLHHLSHLSHPLRLFRSFRFDRLVRLPLLVQPDRSALLVQQDQPPLFHPSVL